MADAVTAAPAPSDNAANARRERAGSPAFVEGENVFWHWVRSEKRDLTGRTTVQLLLLTPAGTPYSVLVLAFALRRFG